MIRSMRIAAFLPVLAFALICSAGAQTYDSTMFGGLSYRLIGPYRAGRSLACSGVPGSEASAP